MRFFGFNFKNKSLVTAILSLAFGALLISAPELVAAAFVKIFGAVLLAVAVVRLAVGLMAKPSFVSVYAIVMAIIGASVYIFSGSIVEITNVLIRIVFGLFLAVHGINGIMRTLSVRRDGEYAWIAYVVLYAVFVGIGVSSLVNTFNPSAAFTQIIGVVMVVSAVVDIISMLSKKQGFKRRDDGYIETEYEDKTK